MYILITRYITLISVDAVFDVGSDSDLRRELGARLGLTFSKTRALRALAVICPWDAQKVTFWEQRNGRCCEITIMFRSMPARPMMCPVPAGHKIGVSPLNIVRYAAPKLRLHRF